MADDNDKDKKKGEGNESDSKKTNTQTDAFDPKKLSEEDLAKVFEDPRIWEHKRFKELNDSAKAGKKALEKLEQLEKDKLVEEGKFKELAEKEKARADEAQKALQDRIVDNALQAEAVKQGAKDLEAVLKLVDRSKINVSEDGVITGADETVKGLLESKPYLKDANAQAQVNIGSGTQPGTDASGAKKFTHSQIQDPKFYEENKVAIQEAMRTGNIIDDIAPGTPQGPRGPQA